MKRTLTKDFHFTTYGGPDCYKAGTVLTGKQHEHGLLMENFICYGINDLIHEEYFTPQQIQPASDLSAAMGRVVEQARARGFTVVELIFVLFIVAILALLAFDGYRRENEQMPAAFAAWEKQTGNEKHLTYKEWRALMRANQRNHDTTFVFIPQ